VSRRTRLLDEKGSFVVSMGTGQCRLCRRRLITTCVVCPKKPGPESRPARVADVFSSAGRSPDPATCNRKIDRDSVL
jgi:hypothetical protein